MYLKKAFQLQNLIKRLLTDLQFGYLGGSSYCKTIQEHKKEELNKFLPDLATSFENEVKEIKDTTYDKYDINVVFEMYDYLIDQQSKLTSGINVAKSKVKIKGLTYDAAVVNAKARRNFISNLKSLIRNLPEEPKISERLVMASFQYKDSLMRFDYPMVETLSTKEGVYESIDTKINQLSIEAEALSEELEKVVMTTNIPKEYEVEITSDTTLTKLYNKFANK
jgi:hypothetical protein